MRVLMGGQEVPFSSHVNVGDILMKLNEIGRTVQDDSDEDIVSNKLGSDAGGKKRKRKRGKAV
jgi:hypothetical protein